MLWRCAILLAALLLIVGPVRADFVGPAPKVDEIVEQSDIIFKGTVLSTAPSESMALKPSGNFQAHETKFKVISILKSPGPLDQVNFQHYDTPSPYIFSFEPQHHHFEVGKTYLVCARKTDEANVFQQLWTYPTMTDGGVVRCANDHPLTAKTFPEALVSEMVSDLPGASDEEALRLIAELDRLSGGGTPYYAEAVFDRRVVLAGVHPFMTSANPKVAQAALRVVGASSPFLTDDDTLCWVNTRGAVKISNLGTFDPQRKNPGGDLYRNELLAVAGGNADADTRAIAVATLGLVAAPAFQEPLGRWLADPSPAVRRSATLLLADFPDLATHEQLEKLTKDAAPEVRAATAAVIGIGQQPEKADLLVKLLDDHEFKVRQAAVASLVTFSPRNAAIAAIFRANVDRSEFAPIFFNAIALDDPAAHLDGLARVVAHKTEPDNPWVGETPYLFAWEILLDYLQARPAAQLASGKFAAGLDALGKVIFVSDTDQITQTRGFHPHESSGLLEIERESNIRDIAVPAIVYAFYQQRGMTDRARKYRLWSMKTTPEFASDLDTLFQIVDENPSLYKRG